MTPGWVTGSADLFKEPLSTPSPFKGRVMTRRYHNNNSFIVIFHDFVLVPIVMPSIIYDASLYDMYSDTRHADSFAGVFCLKPKKHNK